MTDAPYCPWCGTKRLGAFRFCRGCRLDFDTLPVAEVQVAPAPTTPATLWAMPTAGVVAWVAGVPADRARPERAADAWGSTIITREQLPDGW